MWVHCFIGFTLNFVRISYSQKTTPDGCFVQYDNAREKCLEPFHQKDDVMTQHECTQLFRQHLPLSKAADYEPSKTRCNLYHSAFHLHTGRSKRSSTNGMGMSVKVQQPNNNNGGWVTYLRCDGSNSFVSPCPGHIYFVPTTECQSDNAQTTMTPPTTLSLPPQATCPIGTVVKFMLVQERHLAGNPDSTFAADNEQSCVKACTDNSLPNGKNAPCQSADFNTDTRECQIYLTAMPPSGNGTINPNPAVNHYEKMCVDENLAQNCAGPFVVAPQKILIGYAETVSTATSEKDCIQQCSNSQARFGFHCQSGLFYYQDTSSNCILNSESASTKPNIYVDETEDIVDYFEPHCSNLKTRHKRSPDHPKILRKRNVLLLKSNEWGSWTRCDNERRNRQRYRDCSTFNPNHCQSDKIDCDSSNRAKEWADIILEEKPTATDINSQSSSVEPESIKGLKPANQNSSFTTLKKSTDTSLKNSSVSAQQRDAKLPIRNHGKQSI